MWIMASGSREEILAKEALPVPKPYHHANLKNGGGQILGTPVRELISLATRSGRGRARAVRGRGRGCRSHRGHRCRVLPVPLRRTRASVIAPAPGCAAAQRVEPKMSPTVRWLFDQASKLGGITGRLS